MSCKTQDQNIYWTRTGQKYERESYTILPSDKFVSAEEKKKYLKDSAYVTEDKFKLHPELLKDLLNLLLYIPLPKMGHADPSQALALARWATQALLVCLYQQES